jgi:hypothetical protein
MRTLLVLLAAVGLPLGALAQPAADDGKPTEVSEVVVEAHTGRCPPGNPDNSDATSKRFATAPDTISQRTEESAGTRALLLAIIAGSENKDVDYTHMTPALAKLTRSAVAFMKPAVACVGAFKGIKFLHVSQNGWDNFETDFSNGALEFTVTPLNPHRMTVGALFFYPQPVSKQFADWLKSMERGRPNYADLTPDLASKLQAQWPALQKSLKDWGRLKGFRFVRREDNGAYVYLATYEHRLVVWTALPNADGKFTALTYDE